jgi:hypothetical protein
MIDVRELKHGAYYRNGRGELGRWDGEERHFLCVKRHNIRSYTAEKTGNETNIFFTPIYRVFTNQSADELSFYLNNLEYANAALQRKNVCLQKELGKALRRIDEYKAVLGVKVPEELDMRDLAWRSVDVQNKVSMFKVKDLTNSHLNMVVRDLRQQIMRVRLQTGETSLSFLTLQVMEEELARRNENVQPDPRRTNL